MGDLAVLADADLAEEGLIEQSAAEVASRCVARSVAARRSGRCDAADHPEFLGLEDSQFAGFFRSMKLDTPSAVAFCKEHFDMLWDNDDAVMLTNAVGIVDAGVAELRRRLTKLTH